MPVMQTDTSTPLNQADYWIDRQGRRHELDEMHVDYKANCLRFIERRASKIVAEAAVRQALAHSGPRFFPCVIGEANGVAIECGATHEWAHGVWHGAGPMPGSEADNLVSGPTLFDALEGVTHADCLALVRRTALVARLTYDIEHGLGGSDGR